MQLGQLSKKADWNIFIQSKQIVNGLSVNCYFIFSHFIMYINMLYTEGQKERVSEPNALEESSGLV
jgi:hypothetical protein